MDQATFLYVSGMFVLSIGGAYILHLMRVGKAKLEQKAAEILPQEDALKVNDLLDAIDSLAEAAVQDANNLIVDGLKTGNLFTPEVATSIKVAVVKDVLASLEPIKEKAVSLVGPLETIVGKYVEKHVRANKKTIAPVTESPDAVTSTAPVARADGGVESQTEQTTQEAPVVPSTGV